MEYVVEGTTSQALLNHAERMMAEAGYSVQARSGGSITFSGRIAMGSGMQALGLGISLFDPNFAMQTLTAHNTGNTESTTIVAREAPTGATAVMIPDDSKPSNNLLRFWIVADVLRQPLPEPMLRFRDTKPFRGYIGLLIFNDRIEWHEGTWGLKRKGEPMTMEQVDGITVEKGRLSAKLHVRGTDGRVFTMKNLTPEKAEQARALIEQRREVHAGDPNRFAGAEFSTPADGVPATADGAADIPGQIRQLAELKDAGILTEEEFESKKRDLLDRM